MSPNFQVSQFHKPQILSTFFSSKNLLKQLQHLCGNSNGKFLRCILHIDSTFSTSLFSFVDVHHNKKMAKIGHRVFFFLSFPTLSRFDLKRGPFQLLFTVAFLP